MLCRVRWFSVWYFVVLFFVFDSRLLKFLYGVDRNMMCGCLLLVVCWMFVGVVLC